MKMKMKKIHSLAVAAVMSVSLLAGCEAEMMVAMALQYLLYGHQMHIASMLTTSLSLNGTKPKARKWE